jgi:hypothetical protein
VFSISDDARIASRAPLPQRGGAIDRDLEQGAVPAVAAQLPWMHSNANWLPSCRPSNLAPMLTKKDSTSAVARCELKSAVRAAFRQALSPSLKTSDSINGILTVSAINRSRFTYI